MAEMKLAGVEEILKKEKMEDGCQAKASVCCCQTGQQSNPIPFLPTIFTVIPLSVLFRKLGRHFYVHKRYNGVHIN